MRDILTICFAHPSMKGFIMWGFWDGAHWLGNAPMYNQDWTIKQSGTAFIDQVFKKWWTDVKVNSSALGDATLRGYKGKYKITVKLPDGKLFTQNVDLDQDKSVTITTNSTGIKELSADLDLKILPNPAISPAKLVWLAPSLNEVAELQVRNSIGVLVLDKTVNMSDGHAELGNFQQTSGMYLLTLRTKNGLKTMKFMVP
jgi:hypothetical protein